MTIGGVPPNKPWFINPGLTLTNLDPGMIWFHSDHKSSYTVTNYSSYL